MIHRLKTDSLAFDDIASGVKRFEIRFNDRDYEVGDILILEKTKCSGEEIRSGKPLVFTGDVVSVDVTHILKGPIYGLAGGWVIMSLSKR